MKGNGKMPWFAYYPSDFARDTRMLSLEEKGAWHEIIDAMWDAPQRGRLIGTPGMFSRLLGLNEQNTERILATLSLSNVCNMKRDGNGIVTLESRRMLREQFSRENTRLRVSKFRKLHSGNGNVTNKKSEVIYQKIREESASPPPSPPSPPSMGGTSFVLENEASLAPDCVSARKKKNPPILMSNGELDRLALNPAYKGVDIVKEAFKFNEWCDRNKKLTTVRRFVNWLNRVT